MAVSESIRQISSFVKPIEEQGYLKLLSDDTINYLAMKAPLNKKDYITRLGRYGNYRIVQMENISEDYGKTRESAYKAMKVYLRALTVYYKDPLYPPNGGYVKWAKGLYDEQKNELLKLKRDFDYALGGAVAIREKLADETGGRVARPNKEFIQQHARLGTALQKIDENLFFTIALFAAFSLFFVYFVNRPGTVGFASLPNYGMSYILLSIAVLTALIFLFKKR